MHTHTHTCTHFLWPPVRQGSCKRPHQCGLTRSDSSVYHSLALTADRWIPLTQTAGETRARRGAEGARRGREVLKGEGGWERKTQRRRRILHCYSGFIERLCVTHATQRASIWTHSWAVWSLWLQYSHHGWGGAGGSHRCSKYCFKSNETSDFLKFPINNIVNWATLLGTFTIISCRIVTAADCSGLGPGWNDSTLAFAQSIVASAMQHETMPQTSPISLCVCQIQEVIRPSTALST